MNASIFLAQLIGPVSLVGGIGIVLDAAGFQSIAQEFLGSRALIFLSGLLTMTAGLAVVLNHNVWAADWRLLITIFGWLASIGGAARILLPDYVASIGESMVNKPTIMAVGGSVWLVIGAVLCLFGHLLNRFDRSHREGTQQ